MDEKLTINGKHFSHWKEYFHIDIPYDNLNPSIVRDLDLKLLKLNQEAALFYAIANARVQTIGRGTDSIFRQKYNAICQEYKSKNEKLPAAATIEQMAKADFDDIESAKTQFEVEKTFWKDILDSLASIRKILENATWNSKNDLDIKYAKNYGE